LAACLSLSGCAGQCERDSQDGSGQGSLTPDAVVLIVVDTLRADFLPFYGHTPNTAPHLDEALRDAIIFDHAYATSSWTVPSMASLHTGVYPSSHGVIKGDILVRKEGSRSIGQPVLPGKFTTIAEMLRSAGFTTIAVPANQHLDKQFGFAQGFDRYPKDSYFQDARRVNRKVEKFLGEAFGRVRWEDWLTSKTFLWVHYFDPHDPYTPRIPWSRVYAPDYLKNPNKYPAYMPIRRIKNRWQPNEEYRQLATPLYESEIAFNDAQIERLADKIRLFSDNVLVIFVSDHGEEFADHGNLGHGFSLYEEVVRVPLAIRWPKGLKGPKRISTPVSLLDVFPTIAELAGATAPKELQGNSLVPLMRGAPGDPERPLLMEVFPPRPFIKALRKGRYKLLRTYEGETPETPGAFSDSLYDLETDPKERVDIAKSKPDITAELAGELDELLIGLAPPPTVKMKQIDDEQMLQQLINMDYVRDDVSKNILPPTDVEHGKVKKGFPDKKRRR
jgi:arylsulfatase A-like enzyme